MSANKRKFLEMHGGDSHQREKLHEKVDPQQAVLLRAHYTQYWNGKLTRVWEYAIDREIEAMKNRKQTDKSPTGPNVEKELTPGTMDAGGGGVVNLSNHTDPIVKSLWEGMAQEYQMREMAGKMGTSVGVSPVTQFLSNRTEEGLGTVLDMPVVAGPLKDELKRFCANWGVPDMPSEELVKCFLACSLSRERWSRVYDSLKGDVHELVAQAKLVGGAMGNIADVYAGRRIAPDVWKALFTGSRIKASQTGVIAPMFEAFLRQVPSIGAQESGIDQGRQLMLFFARDAVNLREILDDRKVSF